MTDKTNETTESTESQPLLTLTKSDVADKVVGAIITTVTVMALKVGIDKTKQFLETRKAMKAAEVTNSN
jgi:dihydropteroate synthase